VTNKELIEAARILLSCERGEDIIGPLNCLIRENDELRGELNEAKLTIANLRGKSDIVAGVA
jgi:hypothetical protein